MTKPLTRLFRTILARNYAKQQRISYCNHYRDFTTVPTSVRRENENLSSSYPHSSSLTSTEEVWEHTTARILNKSEQNPYYIGECIRYWARQRPIQARHVELTQKLLATSASVDLINIIVDHWRLAIKDRVKVSRGPEEMWDLLKTKNIDERTVGMILSAISYDPEAPYELGRKIMDDLPSHLTPTTILWNALLNVYAKKVDQSPEIANEAMSILQRMTDPNAISYSCVLEVLSLTNDAEQAQAVWDSIDPSIQKSQQSFLHLLEAWSKSTRADGADVALRLLQDMMKKDEQNNTQAVSSWQHWFSAVMTGFARRGQPQKVEELLRELNYLYDRTGDVSLQPSTATMNTILHAYAKSSLRNRAARAQELLNSMLTIASSKPVCQPDTKSFNTVIYAWAESLDRDAVEKVEDLLGRMLKEEIPADTYTYTSVMKAWSRSDRKEAPERCEVFLKAMWEAYDEGNTMVKPNDVTYSTVIYAWSRAKRNEAPARAESIYKEMLSRYDKGDLSLKPSEAVYVSLMMTWTHNVKQQEYGVERARHFFNIMQDKYLAGDISLRPTVKAYSAMIDAYRRAGDGEGAERIFEQMFNDYQNGNKKARPDARVFNFLLSTWANSKAADAPERAEGLLARMQAMHQLSFNCKPSAVGFTSVLNTWAESGREESPERAESILRHMQRMSEAGDRTVHPTSFAYATVIKAWSRSARPDAPERAHALLEEMIRKYAEGDPDCRPSSFVYGALLTTYARSKHPDSAKWALDALNEMARRHQDDPSNERPDNFHYSAVINAFAEKGDVTGAEAILQRAMAADGIHPHDGCYNALMKAYSRGRGSPTEAMKWFRRMKMDTSAGRNECRPTVVTYATLIDIWCGHPEAIAQSEMLLNEMIRQYDSRRSRMKLNAAPFLAYIRVLAASSADDKYQRAQSVANFMTRYKLPISSTFLREMDNCKTL